MHPSIITTHKSGLNFAPLEPREEQLFEMRTYIDRQEAPAFHVRNSWQDIAAFLGALAAWYGTEQGPINVYGWLWTANKWERDIVGTFRVDQLRPITGQLGGFSCQVGLFRDTYETWEFVQDLDGEWVANRVYA